MNQKYLFHLLFHDYIEKYENINNIQISNRFLTQHIYIRNKYNMKLLFIKSHYS